MKITDGKHTEMGSEGPKHETMGGFAGYWAATTSTPSHDERLVQPLWLDTISTSAVLAWAFESYERASSPWSKRSTPRGHRHLLADGVRAAASEIGNGSREFALYVKGIEFLTTPAWHRTHGH
jgi:aldehyde:ferredoxin oxidoreductase